VFGADERSVRAWIDLTRDPVTRNLQTGLPWIGSFESARITRRIITGERPGSATPLEMFSEIGNMLAGHSRAGVVQVHQACLAGSLAA
jgi:hypothetical protein